MTKTDGHPEHPPLVNVASLVFNTPLAIDSSKLAAILYGVGPRLIGDFAPLQSFLNSGVLGERPTKKAKQEAVNAYWDDDDEEPATTAERRPYSLVNGVAIIPVSGTLMDTGGWMSALSGCSSYEGITKALKMAMDDDASVRAVLFKVNSPGGSTNGCFELCDLIYGYRGKKPMYAVSKHLAASAAYAIASAADKVYVSLTGGVGSVGVFALHCDASGMDDQVGLKYTYIKFGAKKTDGNPHEPLSSTAKTDLQDEVDRQGLMFSERVARNRGVSRTKILNLEAAVFCGDEAVPLLADVVGTYDEALADLSSKVLDRSATIPSMAAETHTGENVLNNPDATRTLPNEPPAAPLPAPAVAEMESCKACSGTGKVDGKECTTCSGSGKVDIGENPDDPDSDDDNQAAVAAAAEAALAALQPTSTVPSATAPTPTAEETDMELTATQLLAEQDEIRDICAIAGVDPAETLGYISTKTSLADVKKALRERATTASAQHSLGPGFGAPRGGGSANPLSTLHSLVQTAIAANPARRPSEVMEGVIRANPAMYEAYQDERQIAALVPSATRVYVQQAAGMFPQMGLSGRVG